MNDTPLTDAAICRYRASHLNPSEEVRFEGSMIVTSDFARELERENAKLREELAKSERRWLSLARGVKQL